MKKWKEFTIFRGFSQNQFDNDFEDITSTASSYFPNNQGLKGLLELNEISKTGVIYLTEQALDNLNFNEKEHFIGELRRYFLETKNPCEFEGLKYKIKQLCEPLGSNDISSKIIEYLNNHSEWERYFEQMPIKEKKKLNKLLPITNYEKTFELLSSCYDELKLLHQQRLDSNSKNLTSSALHIKQHINELSISLKKQLAEELLQNLLSDSNLKDDLVLLLHSEDQIEYFSKDLINKKFLQKIQINSQNNEIIINEIIKEQIEKAIPPHLKGTSLDYEQNILRISNKITSHIKALTHHLQSKG